MIGTVQRTPAVIPEHFQRGYEATVRVTIPTPVGPFYMIAGGVLDAHPVLDRYALREAHRALQRQPITARTFPG